MPESLVQEVPLGAPVAIDLEAGQQKFLQPAPQRAEDTSLETLVHHKEAVEANTPLEIAYRAFRDRQVEFMAVVHDGRVIGACSRGQIGFVMGSRFGFAIYSRSPVTAFMVPRPLIITRNTPVREVLDRAMVRHRDDFHEEIVLVDAEQRLLGLIPVEAVAQLQSRLVAEQLDELRQQQATLRQQNLELFRAYHALRQSQGLYLGLFEGHTLGVALLDVNGRIHEHNRRLAELLGFTETPASLLSLPDWMAEHDRASFLQLLKAQSDGKQAPATAEFRFQIPNRSIRLFRCSTGWIRETGQICACLDDITDQRILEQNMLRQEKQKILDTLVGGIAHELNNKLAPVCGFAELLNRETGNHTRRYAELIMKNVIEAADIIKQLLQLSKPIVPVTRAIDLREVVEETLLMLRFQLRETKCEVRTVLPSAPVWVMADGAQLKQVALNLMLNAIHAMEGRSNPLLKVETRTTGKTALLLVQDNGCGIAPENLGRVFDPFFTTKGSDRGSGLGLSICFSIVRQHGGEIRAESQLNSGSCFTVSLPLEERNAEVFIPSDDDGQQPLAVPRGLRVLVVEDDEVVQRLLQEILRTQFGCLVDLVGNGEEALAALEARDYAMILSDIRMPVLNGTDFYLRLRESRPEMVQRFAFITGHPGERHLEAEIAKWKVPVIAKPFLLPKFAETCGLLLRTTVAEN